MSDARPMDRRTALRVLRRRYDFLASRIRKAARVGRALAYDAEELAALAWLLGVVEPCTARAPLLDDGAGC